MLDYLRIHDLALIEDAALDFDSGINVLSGETGAGKSFILKALGFVTGDKLETDLVRAGKEKAVAEAVFIMSEDENILLRRELTADKGRSRLFVNDKLSSQEGVKELRPSLILHTSQHGQQKLLQSAYQNKILEDFLDRPDLMQAKSDALANVSTILTKRTELKKRYDELSQKRELLEFQLQEIDKVKPKHGEEEKLELQRKEIRDAESQVGLVEDCLTLLYGEGHGGGLIEGFSNLERSTKQLAQISTEFEASHQGLEELYPTLNELASSLRRIRKSTVNFNADAIESRLFVLAQLKRKLHRSLEEILQMRDEIDENLSFLDSCALEIKQLDREKEAACRKLSDILNKLNPAKRAAANELKLLLENELRELGFSEHVEIIFNFESKPLVQNHPETSEDKSQFLWKPNPGQSSQPLDKIASGGELSRFLLALVTVMAQRSTDKPTLIFDEVDAGVGGLTLNKVAEKLVLLGKTHQIILITHWPMLASKANRHFLIKKDVREGETFTSCLQLKPNEIKDEIARMAGGGEQGEVVAKQLMD